MEVQAQGYYNHIKNSGFEPYSNWIEDGSAESGGWDNGISYGNFTNIDAHFDSVTVYNGVYSFNTHYASAPNYKYVFNENYQPLTDDIENFTVWIYPSAGVCDARIQIYYVEGGSDLVDWDMGASGSWKQIIFDQPTYYDLGKHIEYFEVNNIESITIYWDNWALLIDDGEFSQTDINLITYPFYSDQVTVDFDLDINTGFSYQGDQCAYMGFEESGNKIIQDINYIDSDSIGFINMYAYTQEFPSGNTKCGVTVKLVYSDRTGDSHTEYIGAGENATWVLLSYGSAWIDANKYVILMSIELENQTYYQHVNFDEVGLWSTDAPDTNFFDYDLEPSGYVNEKNINGFEAYTLHDYTFTGHVYDENNSLTEDGTFQVIHDIGTQSGSIVNGIFTFTLYERSSTYDFSENLDFTIIIITPNSRSFTFMLQAYWLSSTGDSGGSGGAGTDTTADFMTLFLLIFVPPLIFAFAIGAKADSGQLTVVGFIAGLLLTTAIGAQSGLIDIWFVFVNLVIMVVLGLAMVKM